MKLELDPQLIRFMLIGVVVAAAIILALLLLFVPFGWIGSLLVLGAGVGAGFYWLNTLD